MVGRLPGIGLTTEGHAQAARLAARLEPDPVSAIYASPLQRAIETTRPLASACGLEVQIRNDLIEVEFGDWTGRTFIELDDDPAWHNFNTRRGRAVVPHGEPAGDVQRRITRALDSIARSHPGGTIVVVSHAEVIRGAVLQYAGR